MRNWLRTVEWKHPALLGLGFVLLLSYFSYFHRYWEPKAFFWDENYHVAAAQKYLHGVHFMEPHPPLGKELIALGEKLIGRNEATDQFIGTDYGRNPPKGFDFLGYRLFPTLLAWLTAPLFFGVLWLLTRNALMSTLLSFLYVFDNAIIVHSRSAMLESTIHFCMVAMLFLFFWMLASQENSRRLRIAATLFGAVFGALMATKLNGLIMILLVPFLLLRLWPNFQRMLEVVLLGILGFVIVYVTVWQIHFALGKQIVSSLPDAGYYKASAEYKAILERGDSGNILHFPVMLEDSFRFTGHYERGVPDLDLCKTDENGSPWFLWPVGARTINYRWETPNGYAYKYLYLVSNPAGWLFGFAGVLAAAAVIAAWVFLPLREPVRHWFPMVVLLALYGGYLAAVSRIDRVMYLYHYFPPLIFSYLLLALVLLEIRRVGPVKIGENLRMAGVFLCALIVFASYEFYRPFTYYEPITKEQFQGRDLLRIWDMRCVNCERNSPLVKKTC